LLSGDSAARVPLAHVPHVVVSERQPSSVHLAIFVIPLKSMSWYTSVHLGTPCHFQFFASKYLITKRFCHADVHLHTLYTFFQHFKACTQRAALRNLHTDALYIYTYIYIKKGVQGIQGIPKS
jgi:hypothetical protein